MTYISFSKCNKQYNSLRNWSKMWIFRKNLLCICFDFLRWMCVCVCVWVCVCVCVCCVREYFSNLSFSFFRCNRTLGFNVSYCHLSFVRVSCCVCVCV